MAQPEKSKPYGSFRLFLLWSGIAMLFLSSMIYHVIPYLGGQQNVQYNPLMIFVAGSSWSMPFSTLTLFEFSHIHFDFGDPHMTVFEVNHDDFIRCRLTHPLRTVSSEDLVLKPGDDRYFVSGSDHCHHKFHVNVLSTSINQASFDGLINYLIHLLKTFAKRAYGSPEPIIVFANLIIDYLVSQLVANWYRIMLIIVACTWQIFTLSVFLAMCWSTGYLKAEEDIRDIIKKVKGLKSNAKPMVRLMSFWTGIFGYIFGQLVWTMLGTGWMWQYVRSLK